MKSVHIEKIRKVIKREVDKTESNKRKLRKYARSVKRLEIA